MALNRHRSTKRKIALIRKIDPAITTAPVGRERTRSWLGVTLRLQESLDSPVELFTACLPPVDPDEHDEHDEDEHDEHEHEHDEHEHEHEHDEHEHEHEHAAITGARTGHPGSHRGLLPDITCELRAASKSCLLGVSPDHQQ
ncbi:hypothetical protein [Promicromonospora sp. NPDC090134]|uniref:hypothetical protein n=1 Tax=Promicromonospora sp. NPDC090134 TaxID=3364408 RepID=UPI00380E1572